MLGTMSITTANIAECPCATVTNLSSVDLPPTDLFAPLSVFVSAARPIPPVEDALPILAIAHHFANVPDPRHPAFRNYHLLDDILVLALTAVLSGCKSWEAISDFGVTKEAWFRSIGLKLPHGIPSHDTFNRTFATMNPVAFQQAFSSWINGICNTLGFCHIPIDGKAVRGSRGPDGTCLHLVSAWACQNRLTLAQVAVADKSNEITAIPRLLQLLDLSGALVSIDAIGCQKNIAKMIRDGGGDYLFALKDNQETLHTDVQTCFAQASANGYEEVKYDIFVSVETNHGRYEERVVTVIYEPVGLSTQEEWKDLKTIVEVVRKRREGDKESVEVEHYISSSEATAMELAEVIRDHWSIENSQHWVLDVVFSEDRCRSRHKNAAENLGWLRKMALACFNQDDSKGSIPTRMVRASASDEYRLHLLSLFGEKSA
jgi:predicted transposase YbfD/YdcC